MSTTGQRADGSAPRSAWEFTEHYPWERGFAAYFRDWIAPELSRWRAARRARDQGFRRRLPLLTVGWLGLTLLIAETSGSLPITLIWAILLLIVGGTLARGPVNGERIRILNTVRDRVIGYFDLRPLGSGRVLESALRAHGLPRGESPVVVSEQFWGLHRGLAVRLGRLPQHGGGGPPFQKDPQRRGIGTPAHLRQETEDLDAPEGPEWLVLLIESEDLDASPSSGRWLPGPDGLPAHREGLATDILGAARSDCDDGLEQGLQALSRALGGAVLDYAREPSRLLILAHGGLGTLDWSRHVEAWEQGTEEQEIESAIRALLASLHRLLEAAHLLAARDCEKI